MKKKYIIGAICLIVVIALAYQYNEDQKKYEAYMKERAAYNEKMYGNKYDPNIDYGSPMENSLRILNDTTMTEEEKKEAYIKMLEKQKKDNDNSDVSIDVNVHIHSSK